MTDDRHGQQAGISGTVAADCSPSVTTESLRAEFPVTDSRAYLFTGGIAPASRTVARAVEEWIERWSLQPAGVWDELLGELDAVRVRLARLLSVNPGSIAIVDGVSRASNLAVGLLPVRSPANVVVDATTYKSSLYPWLVPERCWAEVRRAPSGDSGLAARLEDLEPIVDNKTVAVSITHVDPRTGFRHDLRPIADLAHAHGAMLIVDVAQSAGAVPLNLVEEGVDLAAGTAMKWLLGPPGIGFLYVSEALLAITGAPQVGYLGARLDAAEPPNLVLSPDARRHELGLPNLLGMPGFRAGLDLILAVGVSPISRHIERLTDRLLEGLLALGLEPTTPHDPSRRAGLMTVPAEQPDALHRLLRECGVDVWSHHGPEFIRADAHLFNNDEDIDRLLEGLAEYRRLHGAAAIQGSKRSP